LKISYVSENNKPKIELFGVLLAIVVKENEDTRMNHSCNV